MLYFIHACAYENCMTSYENDNIFHKQKNLVEIEAIDTQQL